jgi:CBS domain-containing protein
LKVHFKTLHFLSGEEIQEMSGKLSASYIPARFVPWYNRIESIFPLASNPYVSKGASMKVKEVMTTSVITIREDRTKKQAAYVLAEHHISGLPVVNKQRDVVGIVTNYDILAKPGQRVCDVMTCGIISVSPDMELDEIMRIFSHERLRRLLVLEQGRLVGIVSRADLMKAVPLNWLCSVCGELTHSYQPPASCSRCTAKKITTFSGLVAPGF